MFHHRRTLATRDRLLLVCLAIASITACAFALNEITRSAGASAVPPSPVAQSDFVRQIALVANDVIYSPSTQMLYASVPSSAGAGGNSIKTIDPSSGTITNSVFIGSEPNKLALADDGTTLYTALNGAFAIRRFNISTQTPGSQFQIGQDTSNGPYYAADLAALPGTPDSVAVARWSQSFGTSTGVAVFDNGVRRTNTANSGSSYLAFSASSSKLYGSGYYNGLTTMNVNASGVSVSSTLSFASSWRVKFDNGLIYAGNGQVINPDTATLLGTFSGTNTQAFVPDSSVGRAYYLVNDQYNNTRTLKAFDINTFLPVGSLTINGVVGDASNLVRWGSNGLAFRTSGNQLFIIQTSLIPSGDPIPTPTPTPSPSPSPSPRPIATFVQQISLSTNDLIYDSATQLLYASVPSSVGGTRGNSITPVDPATAIIGNSIFVGSEPNKLALSDDLQTLYVGLTGAGAVRRFDINSQTAGSQFTLGNDPNYGPRFATDIAVMPGARGSIAVNRNTSSFSPSIAIYDDGVQRTQTYNNSYSGSLQFRDSATLYFANGPIQKLAVNASGISFVSTTQTGSSGNISYNNGLVYMSGGAVVDPEAGLVKGTFTGMGYGSLMAVDPDKGRVFFLSGSGFPWTLSAYDINTFLPLGSVTIPGNFGTATSLIRWGTNGLAFRTTSGQIFLIQTALVDPTSSVPSPTPTPSPSPSPPYIPTFVQKVDLQANDLVINQSTQSIYASVPSAQGANGNSITKIDPQTVTIGPSVFIGSEPNKLALSSDGNTLYASLDGAAAIRRFDIPTMTPGAQFTWGTSTQRPADMAVVPGAPQSLATSDGYSGVGVAIYDDGVRRTKTSRGFASSLGPIAFGSDPAMIYACDTYTFGPLVKFSVDATGVTPVTNTNSLLTGSVMKFSNGLLYSSGGRVVDPELQKLIGTFQPAYSNAFAVDRRSGRVFFLSNNSPNLTLTAYDINTFVPIGSVNVPVPSQGGTFGQVSSLVRWGTNGLAFRAISSNPPNYTSSSAVYLLQSQLVSSNGSIPTGLQFSSATYGISEGYPYSLTVTVNRSGDVSSTTSVDYMTSDGTAKAGSDYTSTSGTLTFAPGELSKTFTVPIIDDNLYEGAPETFNLSLSNPSSGANSVSPSSATATIYDNDSRPYISIGSVSSVEGNSGQKAFTFPVTLSNPSVETVKVDFTTADGTATVAGNDYVATSGTLTLAPGTVSNSITVLVNGDTTIEPDETFLVKLSNAVNASFILTPQATGTILNDDTLIQFSSASYSVAENAGSATITITRTGNAGTATVLFSTSNGTATSGDYTPVSQIVTFNSGQFTKTVTVPITDDSINEANETINLTLSNLTGPAQLGAPSTAVLTIIDNDPPPSLSINDVSATEGDSGNKTFTFTVALSAASGQTVTVNYVTADWTATAGSDYVSTNGTLTFNPGDLTETIRVTVNGDQLFEPNETFFVNLANPANATISKAQGTGTILNDDAQGSIISFSQANYSVGESDGLLIITVNRTGDTSAPSTVDYATSDGGAPCVNASHLASSKCDFTTALGTLRFAGGDSSKTFAVLINQDSFVEGPETLSVTLSNLTGGAVLGATSIAVVTINDDVTEPPTNTIDDAANFIREHYHDFLNREADQSGLDFWISNFTQCGGDPQCLEVRRINVSAAFFLSIEFQQTGYLVERIYKASYGDATGTSNFPSAHQLPVPIVRFNEFLADTQQIGQGVVVGQTGWQQALENNKQAFASEFVQRSRFTTTFPLTMTPAQFVDALFANTGVTASSQERQDTIALFGGAATTANTTARAAALRRVAENSTFAQQEFNRAFVLMQFFGYLRRNPNDPQDPDYTGYDFWLTKLNQFNGNFQNAEMVKAFISSLEYRQRFGP